MFRGGDYVEVDPTGRYGRFEDVLGRGAMKTVYRAFDELHGLEVAWNRAKLSNVLRSPEALERLYSEVHLLSTLSHDSIIRFHTSWVDSEKRTFNFITEMFTSGTLREYRQRYKHVDVRAVKNWARQILHGLVYLHGHDQPVIHRDLKCDNIFVNGNLGLVKIGDLGLAAVLRDSQPARSVIGTPEFMAPELYDEEYNELVDVYSFGMCFLEMLTAQYPYSECSNPAQIYKKVTSGKLPAAFYKIQNLEAQRFIGRCLQVASKRPSAQELLLDPFLQPGSSDPPSTSSRTASQGQLFSPNPLIHRPKPIRSTDMRITGRMHPDDDSITLWVQMVDKHGDPRNIYFPFDIVSDTAVDVANEMVNELEINDRDPSQIAIVIDQEITSLVPNWKERSPGDNQLHIYNYVDTDDEIPHPFFYQSSPTSSQGSYFSLPPPQNSQIHHSSSTSHAHEWFQDNGTTHDGDDDDTNSQSSMYSGKYSYVNCNSGSEHDPESSSQRQDAQRIHSKNKSSRFSPELLNEKFQKQCKVLPECSQQSASHGTRRSSDNHQLMRNRSLVDIRSQLLHQALVEQVNKRMFKTVSAVEDIGYQNPCETSGKKKKSHSGFAKNLGLTWGK